MEFLLSPDVSYVLLILGFMAAILALFSPGTGVLEVIALFAMAMAAYGIVNMPVNWWALAIMALGVVPLVMVLRREQRRRNQLMLLASLAFIVGATLLYRWNGWLPGVNIALILLLAPLMLGLTWFISTKTLEAIDSRPSFDLDRLVGMTGRATTDIRGQGTVYVNGEEWTARSKTYIPTGATVRVLRRKGLALEVEPEKL